MTRHSAFAPLPWHACEVDEALSRLQVDADTGLDTATVTGMAI